MYRKILSVLVFFVVSFYSISFFNVNNALSSDYVNTGRADFSEIAGKLLPTVVNISTVGKVNSGFQIIGNPNMPSHQFDKFAPMMEDMLKNFYGIPQMGEGSNDVVPLQQEVSTLGSGFIIDAKNGYIITNRHVVDNADEITVTLNDNTKIKADLVGSDEKTDVAIIKVKETKGLVAATWGNSDALPIGSWVLAIGNPFGLGGTVTTGIVSGRNRDINAGPYDDFIQTDASINKGNSGGPMFNTKGEVVGINTAIFSTLGGGSIGIGFAIPANMAKPVIDQIIKYGSTKRGWLGVKIQPVTDDMAESLGLEKSVGAMVTNVTPNSPSAKAGLEKGDIITEFDGHTIDKMRSLPKMVAYSEVGKNIKLKVWRKGEFKEITVTLGELEKAEKDGLVESEQKTSSVSNKNFNIKELGINGAALTTDLIKQYGLSDKAQGILVINLDVNGSAAAKGLRNGDLIKEANQVPTNLPSELNYIIKEAKDQGKSSVLLFVDRKGDERFVAVKIKEDK